MDLIDRKCVPCEGGVPKLEPKEIAHHLRELAGWIVSDDQLRKTLRFDTFRQAIDFINELAPLAEAEGHHPDFCVHYSRVDLTLWTHAIGGLSENDFILAAKIDALTLPTQ